MRELQAETGRVLVHPYDDPLVIAGQGTVGLELVEQVPDLDTVIVPIGGGGLISGSPSRSRRCPGAADHRRRAGRLRLVRLGLEAGQPVPLSPVDDAGGRAPLAGRR